MIIKSMSRKHPSFAQLIDYIEGESKLKSRRYSIHHNLYSRDRESLKREFETNAAHLKARKNGVYLYHEVLSIKHRAVQADELNSEAEDRKKAILSHIVREYLGARGRHNLAYAVLHEDTDNLHFHIVMSANAVGEEKRTRLSKVQFAEIQTRLEAWVLKTHPELEQKPVFYENQTSEERQARENKRDHQAASHLSNRGEELKRRGGSTSTRDDMQEKLAEIFATATNPRQFTELLEKAGLNHYQRGKNHGVIDREGKKYRFSRLGLDDAWQALDERMTAVLQTGQAKAKGKDEDETRAGEQMKAKSTSSDQQAKPQETTQTEAEKRLAEITAMRAERAKKAQENTAKQNNRDRDR